MRGCRFSTIGWGVEDGDCSGSVRVLGVNSFCRSSTGGSGFTSSEVSAVPLIARLLYILLFCPWMFHSVVWIFGL